MATMQPVASEEGTERLRDRFLREYGDDSDEIDSRDMLRVRNNFSYVRKFLAHKFGDEEAGYEMLVGALKWRKTYGVHDLKHQDVDTSLVDGGLAYHHGIDRENNTIIVLNCHLHKKDPKKLAELEKFFVFALESHSRRYPDKRVTLIFNMSQCGLSNMDLDFVKVIINSFKFYFPCMLGYLLVFEMPWLLQAAWKIIKSWLSEVAVRKIKFVTKSDITDYIPPDQLLVAFGGEDSWQYNPEIYRKELEEEGTEIWEQDPLALLDKNDKENNEDDLEEEEEEEEEKIKEETENEHYERQVRFAPGQPPTHQSRYGNDEDTDTYSRQAMSLDSQLLRGTAASPGYRRRQVNRLMKMTQSSGRPTHASSIDYGDLQYGQSRKPPGYVLISPVDELHFCGQSDQDLYCTLQLTNTSEQPLAYKIKTTAPKRYKVRPNINIIDGQSKASVQVQLIMGNAEAIAQDKFLIQTYLFDDNDTPPDSTQLNGFWKDLDPIAVQEHRLKCRYSVETPQTTEDVVVSKRPTLDQAKKVNDPSPAVIRKLDRLTAELTELRLMIKHIKYFSVVTLSLVILIFCILLMM